jgi:alpha-beta hydrolase superfamily lysophospholipase
MLSLRYLLPIYLICFLIVAKAFAQTPATNNFTEEPVKISQQVGELAGTLVLPQNVKKPTVVLLIAGSGATDRNGNNPFAKNNSLKMLAEGLAQQGFASLRYDKRGIGESAKAAKQEEDLRFDDYVSDAEQWVNLLQKDSRIGKIVVLGHSEGALIGCLTAQKTTINAYISLAGAGRPISEVITEQLAKQPAQVQQESKQIMDSLLMGQPVKNVPFYLMALYRPSVQPYLMSWFRYSPTTEIAQLKCPILIIQGTKDLQVLLKDAENLQKAAPKATYAVLDNMNHVLKHIGDDANENMASYAQPDKALHVNLVPTIVEFLKKL